MFHEIEEIIWRLQAIEYEDITDCLRMLEECEDLIQQIREKIEDLQDE